MRGIDISVENYPTSPPNGCRSPLFCTPTALAGVGVGTRGTNPGPRRLPPGPHHPLQRSASLSLQQKTRQARWVSREQLSVHRRLPVGIFHWGRLGVLLLFWIQTFFFHCNISTNLPALQLLDFCTCSRVHGMFALNAW